MYHAKIKMWLQPGGHADGDSNLLRVALKEVKEETGIENVTAGPIIDIDIGMVPEVNDSKRGKVPKHLHYDIVFLFQTKNEDFTPNEESCDMRWFSIEEAPPSQDPSILRVWEKLKKVQKSK